MPAANNARSDRSIDSAVTDGLTDELADALTPHILQKNSPKNT
jgi:hypothetical protein